MGESSDKVENKGNRGQCTVGIEHLVKTCKYGHYWYTGQTCPLCDYLGRDNLRNVQPDTDRTEVEQE